MTTTVSPTTNGAPGSCCTTEPGAATAASDTDDDDLKHIYCGCDEDRGLCGADVTGAPVIGAWSPDPDTCVVCLDLDPRHQCTGPGMSPC